MVETLKEINLEHWVEQLDDAIKNKLTKKEPKFLEEQIRDHYPCEVELKDEEDENI